MSKAARRTPLILTVAALGLVVVAAAALQGHAEFTGPRWNPQYLIQTTPGPEFRERMQRPTGLPAPAETGTVRVDAVLLWVGVLIAVLIIAVLIWRYLVRRPRRALRPLKADSILVAPDESPSSAGDELPAPPVVRRGLASALELLEAERIPSDAIVKAWLGLQHAADDSGVHRRPAETPTEFTARIIRRVGADETDIRTLVTLYQDVRFGGRPSNADDVQEARAALQRLSEVWR